MKHVLPPTIFFFVGFNLILWTKRLILEEHGVEFSEFLIATLATLLVGKAILVTDKLPFMRRFEGAPLIQPMFKSAIYWLLRSPSQRATKRGRTETNWLLLPWPPVQPLPVAAYKFLPT